MAALITHWASAGSVSHFFIIIIVIRHETTATARWALPLIVRALFNDAVTVAVWTGFGFHVCLAIDIFASLTRQPNVMHRGSMALTGMSVPHDTRPRRRGDRMKRREFITFLVGGAYASLRTAAWAQSPQQVRRVGVLLPFDENDPEVTNRVKQFRLGMRARFKLDRRT
jgi:hypothetical protein